MPNIKSAKKRMKQNENNRQRNLSRKTALKTAVRRVKEAIAKDDIEGAKTLLKDAEAKIARAAGKKVLHKNAASRRISRLAKRVSNAVSGKAQAAA